MNNRAGNLLATVKIGAPVEPSFRLCGYYGCNFPKSHIFPLLLNVPQCGFVLISAVPMLTL